MNNDIHNYDDIINLPRHISKKHPQMSRKDRAAQFAPFAALTGHKDAIRETERLITQKKVLDEDQKVIINNQLQRILYKTNTNLHICYNILFCKLDNN